MKFEILCVPRSIYRKRRFSILPGKNWESYARKLFYILIRNWVKSNVRDMRQSAVERNVCFIIVSCEGMINVPVIWRLTHVRIFAGSIKDQWKFSTRLHGRENKFLCPRVQGKIFYEEIIRANAKFLNASRNII